MIESNNLFRIHLITGMFFYLLMNSSLSAQLFVDEGLERNFDAIASGNSTSAPGVSAVDFDRDGDDDLTIASQGEVFFFLNTDGQFEQVQLGIEPPPGDVAGVIWTDINNDGHLDILLSAYNGGIRLYKNLGGLSFVDITESCGISNDVTTNWGISFSDIDRDGLVDLQLCRYETEPEIPNNPSIMPELWTRLYLNNGDDTFIDYTTEGGLIIPPSPVFMGVFLDFNNDLWPDNYTIVDRLQGNKLFVNDQGTFSDITDEFDASYPDNDIMSNTVADYNNDGYLDIFMTNDSEETFLLENGQGESFTNVADAVGVSVDVFGWGAIWIDADNDGWQDLFFGIPAFAPDYFFMNDQGLFTQQETAIEVVEVPSFSAAKGDFDGDGYYDMIVQSISPNRSPLLINQGGENHYIKITPNGTVSNSMASGSWVKVYANGEEYVHYTLCGEGYISQNSQHLIFGLGGETTVVDSVTVWYPSGHTDSYYNLAVDSDYRLFEGDTYEVSIEPSETALCEGAQVVLDAGEHQSYLWNTGENTRFISTDTAGVYSVTVINEFGISASNDITVEFFPDPIVLATVLPNACAGDSAAVISLENLLGTPAEEVVWDNGMMGPTIDSLFSGDYAYVFSDVNGCTTSGTVSVFDPSELLVFANSGPEDVDQNNGTIDLTIFGGVPPYVVIFEGDTVDATITDLTAGEYTITIIDTYGCVVTVDITVDSTLGLAGNKPSDSISVYPNPTGGRVEINSELAISRVVVYGSTGVLEKNEYTREDKSVNLENLASGLYLLQVELANSQVGYFRIVKE